MKKKLEAPPIVKAKYEAKAQVRADTNLLSVLLDTTPAEAEAWVENNVNSMADAKNLMKKMVKVLVYLTKKELS